MLMTLSGPRSGALALARPRAQLLGVFDTLKKHPLVLIGGLVLGGYLARSKFNFGSIWGGHKAEELRTKTLKGHKGRRKGRR